MSQSSTKRVDHESQVPNGTHPVDGTTTDTSQHSIKRNSYLENHHPKESHHNQQLLRNFKLISVNFKEAALDSPSFRASVNHYDLQLQNIEQWLVALNLSIKKIPRHVRELQSFCNSFLEHLVPTFIQDGLIDQEYTVQSLQITLRGLKNMWSKSFAALSVNTGLINKINTFKKTLHKYKELRRSFEVNQKKYDKYLAIFVSTSKSKDPLMVMEDAKQLFHVRKDYIHSSLDVIVELQIISIELDKLLLDIISNLWKDKLSEFMTDEMLRDQFEKVERIQCWHDSYSQATMKLSGNMISARKQVEDGCLLQFQPSMNANDYKSTLLNNKVLYDIEENSVEKHSYLFMKTYIEKSSKPVWVKRWCFIKNGVFGMLVLSPSQTFVQESDKIGVLLCNVRYSPNEDRRFCFEIRTSELTLTCQAESLIELKSWLKVFENEKQRGSKEDINLSSNVYPPIILECASSVNTVTDKQLSNTRITTKYNTTILSSSLSNHIEKYGSFFEKYIYFQIPRIHPPLTTDTTKSSIIAYSLVSPTPIPTALTANIWGSVNWGLYYLLNTEDEHPVQPDLTMVKFQEEHLGNGIQYPSFYPNDLVNLDIQMRSLFETSIPKGEYLVMSYGCIWSPNSKQELSGRCFMTSHHLYFYMQALGFVALYKGTIGQLLSVEHTSQKNFDLLKVYNVDGVIKLKLFQDDGLLVSRKLLFLINNFSRDNPLELKGIVAEFSAIEAEVHAEKEDQKLVKKIKEMHKQLSNKKLITESYFSHTSLEPILNNETKDYKVNFSDQYNYIGEKVYPIPPKAIFHALLGDHSIIFKDQTIFADVSFIRKPWRTVNGNLEREINIPTRKNSNILIKQVIDNMQDNTYYTFTHLKSKFQFFIGPPFTIVYKIVIIGYSGKKSKIYFYSGIQFDYKSIWNPIITSVCSRIDNNQVGKINRKLKTAVQEIGNHGPIVKSIYLYGKLSHTNEPEKVESTNIIKVNLFYATELLIKKTLRLVWKFSSFVLITLIKFFLIFCKGIKMNQVLVLMVVILSLSNLFLIGRSTKTYWTVKRANKLAYDYVTKEPLMLQRSIYLQDVQDLVDRNITLNNVGKPFELFKEKSFIFNFKQDTIWADYFNSDTRHIAQSLKDSFQEIGNKRHSLLVQLNILKNMEKDITEAEWVNWLLSETQRCDHLRQSILPQLRIHDDYINGTNNVISYCNECKEALKGLL
ncbi:unnamed protein product [Candida verbasci]|uniref:Membrane-anchored lipid-binding protein SIP3 n=1 Tax=Candida verbasci TaxID=1227364 RepID=A0A9W4TSP2_9ASCO|nr:unnamed protein product [Candida verbasci]